MKDLLKFARDESVPMLVHWAAVHYEMEGSTDSMTATVEPVGDDTPFCFCKQSGGGSVDPISLHLMTGGFPNWVFM